MPNGFVNDGLFIAGVTNFYFSTPIALTAGQTYYLQPVVLSGDDPWDIITIGDTYSNGRLYGKTGGYFQPSTDFWFREGVSAPEPTALALIGLSSLLVFGFKRRFKLVVLLLLATSILSVRAVDTVVQAVADEAGLAPASALPKSGTFWVMSAGQNGNITALPYPTLPPGLSSAPVYSVSGNVFIVDDSGSQLLPSSTRRMSSVQAASAVQAQSLAVASLIATMQADSLSPGNGSGTNSGAGFYSDSFNYHVPTNGLWLENLHNDSTNLWLRLHGTVGGDNYQLLSTPDLARGYWDLGEILYGVSDGQADFSPVPMTNATTFFWAHHANPVMQIWNSQDSKEPDATNSDPGQTGIIYIQDNGSATNDVAVQYSISGTAQNGIDYSNLTGEVTVSNDQGWAEIDIDPIADGLKPDQTVILTLLQNTNYLINPANDSATNILYANPQVYPVADGDKQYPCPNLPFPYYLQAQDPNNLPMTYSILTWPSHGTLETNNMPHVTYTPTNCYEGQDSFTFKVSDGRYDSAPATVTLTIADSLYANAVSAQTCRGKPVPFYLDAGDSCSEATNYMISTPSYGTVTHVSGQNFTYTPNSASFTGRDTFNYTVYDACDAATSTVTITVGDAGLYLSPGSQGALTGTNRPVAIPLTVENSSDTCTADTNDYTYTITGSLTNGFFSGIPPHLAYTPTNGEGVDSFQIIVSDGFWTPSAPASVTIYVAAGPILMTGCNPFKTGPSVELDWGLDNTVQQMEQQYSFIGDYKIYRASVSGGPYTCIYTNADASQTSYSDTNVVAGQTNYYVVTFEYHDAATGITYESPFSNEMVATGQNSNDLIAPDAIWGVTDITVTNKPVHLGNLRAPFGLPLTYATDHPASPPLVPITDTNWVNCNVWSNQLTLNLTNYTSQQLSSVVYSIAMDNDYKLYVNSRLIDQTTGHYGYATWFDFKPLNVLANLVAGTNTIAVVISGDCDSVDYFSMVVTTNNCGW